MVVDVEVDYSTYDKDAWNGGYRQVPETTTLEIIPNVGIHVDNPVAPTNNWDLQFQLPGVPTSSFDSDTEYTVTLKLKGSVEGNIEAGFSGSGNQQIPVTLSEEEIVLTGLKDTPTAQYWASSGSLMIQSGNYVGEYWITYIKITHEQAAGVKPVEYKPNMLVNGDAEAEWGDLANIVYTDTENTIKVCAWNKEKGVNLDENNAWNPYPATIEEDATKPGNHVFALHGATADTEGDAAAWDNQFWIMSPKELKVGSTYKISFRYRASEAANTNTQMHSAQPSDYLHYQVLGDVAFTTDWQTYDQEVTIPTPQNNRPIYSIAFNLNPQNKNAIDFYFDDLSIQEMDLEEGIFAAVKSENSEFNYESTIAFEADPSEPTTFVGTVGAKDEWVNEVIISTVRGQKKAFQNGSIKLGEALNSKNVETWISYSEVGGQTIQLPAAGIWQIEIDTNEKFARFTQIEGDVLAEPIDIVVNKSELVIEAVERDWLAADNQGNPREEEVGEGQTWDNQFWIVANRVLQAGEETVIEFDYVADAEAKSTTQCQGGEPGPYIHWSAIGDVNFTTEEQHFKNEFTIPNECANRNMQSVSLDFACIKEANNYTIKNVKWYIKSSLNEDGQTTENLISAEGTDNFWVKIGAGTAPYQWGKKPAGLEGDTNGDGEVNVADIDIVIEAIGEEYNKAADANGDGEVNVADADFIIERIGGTEE